MGYKNCFTGVHLAKWIVSDDRDNDFATAVLIRDSLLNYELIKKLNKSEDDHEDSSHFIDGEQGKNYYAFNEEGIERETRNVEENQAKQRSSTFWVDKDASPVQRKSRVSTMFRKSTKVIPLSINKPNNIEHKNTGRSSRFLRMAKSQPKVAKKHRSRRISTILKGISIDDALLTRRQLTMMARVDNCYKSLFPLGMSRQTIISIRDLVMLSQSLWFGMIIGFVLREA